MKFITQSLMMENLESRPGWVITETENGKDNVLKARLVAKAFQDRSSDSNRSDSPMSARERLGDKLAVVATSGWSCHAVDIKTAFLQGTKFNRMVYLCPPIEATVASGHLFKLDKCVYGLVDASSVSTLSLRTNC